MKIRRLNAGAEYISNFQVIEKLVCKSMKHERRKTNGKRGEVRNIAAY